MAPMLLVNDEPTRQSAATDRLRAPEAVASSIGPENMGDSDKTKVELLNELKELREENQLLSESLAEVKHEQQETIQRERLHALGQMASGIVHDFNNALTPILGASDFLITNPRILADTKEALTLLESTRTAARDAKNMVQRLREFYHPEENVEIVAVDVNPLVKQVMLMTQPRWQKQALAEGVSITIETSLSKIPKINVSETQLREVLMNFIFNAVDAMPDGGTIRIATSAKGDCVVIEITDTGKGMDEEVCKRCFEPFFSTKGDNGTGMGLAMCYGIIQRYDGFIDVESTVGEGTTIKVMLPIADASATTGAGNVLAVEESIMVRPLRILIVDDDSLSRGIIRRYLCTDGHTVDIAKTSEDAVVMLKTGSFELVLLDRIMPTVNGEQLAALLRTEATDVPIILLTGHGDFSKEEEILGGIDMVLSKPITQGELRRAIAELIDRQETTPSG